MKQFIGAPPAAPLTPAVRCGQFLFVSGQVPTERDGSIPSGITAQTKLVLTKVKALLEEAGFELSDVVKTTVFLRDLADFDEMNNFYRTFFPVNPPARSCIKASVALDVNLEIEAIAMKEN
jgi:2-iminobutanoate/2-iminopropanoate deaminase